MKHRLPHFLYCRTCVSKKYTRSHRKHPSRELCVEITTFPADGKMKDRRSSISILLSSSLHHNFFTRTNQSHNTQSHAHDFSSRVREKSARQFLRDRDDIRCVAKSRRRADWHLVRWRGLLHILRSMYYVLGPLKRKRIHNVQDSTFTIISVVFSILAGRMLLCSTHQTARAHDRHETKCVQHAPGCISAKRARVLLSAVQWKADNRHCHHFLFFQKKWTIFVSWHIVLIISTTHHP